MGSSKRQENVHYSLKVKPRGGKVHDRPATRVNQMKYEKEPLLSSPETSDNKNQAKNAEHGVPSKLLKFVAWSAASRGLVFDAQTYTNKSKHDLQGHLSR